MHRQTAGLVSGIIFIALAAPAAHAGAIVIDMNGFPCAMGGQVSGPGLAAPIRVEPRQPRATLEGLRAGETYFIDFFHNAGPDGSDFLITLNAKGDGVAAVTRGGERHEMLVGFKPGDATLKLNTRDIVFNANGGQSGPYYIQGLVDLGSVPANAGPLKLKAIPGTYAVDALYGSGGGTEDYSFMVDSQGLVSPGQVFSVDDEGKPQKLATDKREHATYAGNAVSLRAALVRVRVSSPKPLNYYVMSAATPPRLDGNTMEFEAVMPIGATSILFWSFGPNTVTRSNILNGFGKPLTQTRADNDMVFAPRLRYDLAKAKYYFDTTEGPSDKVLAEVNGMEDDKVTALTGVEISATILKPDATPASTQPAR